MMWKCKCFGYEVRKEPETREGRNGFYSVVRLESDTGYSDAIVCRKPELLMNLGLKKGDIIDFDAVASLGGKYPSFFIPDDAEITVQKSQSK